jgi:F-type H+-transporting ATPase subunit delta
MIRPSRPWTGGSSGHIFQANAVIWRLRALEGLAPLWGQGLAAEDTNVSGLAGRYALALLDLAESQKQLDEVASEVGALKQAIADSADLTRFIRSPLFSREQQSKAMAAILDKAGASDLTHRFVLVVAHNRRLFALPKMIDGYLAELARRRGEVTAKVTAARELTAPQRNSLDETLRKVIGAKVKVDLDVDPGLLGGLVVRVGSRMFDSSLRTKLAKLQFAMKGIG